MTCIYCVTRSDGGAHLEKTYVLSSGKTFTVKVLSIYSANLDMAEYRVYAYAIQNRLRIAN
jgi:hypothetical protein